MRRAHLAGLLSIALVAALINALAPTISYVLARSQNLQVVELCTSFGIKKILVDAAGEPAGQEAPSHNPHCQFCMAAQDATAVTIAFALAAKPIFFARSGLICSGCAPRPTPAWLQARPRAPPLRFA